MTDHDDMTSARSVFRVVNEQIASLVGSVGLGDRVSFVCECGNRGCTKRVELTLDEYHAVRTDSRRFLVARGHEDAVLEDVVGKHDAFAIVETLAANSGREISAVET